jgi:antitoxin component YwqK of YwqJK toxin-antitoxin module
MIMKTTYIVLIFTTLTFNLFSQSTYSLKPAFSNYSGWMHGSVDGGNTYRLCYGKKCNGEIIDTFPNGKIKHKGFYINGQLDGEVIDYYENNQRKSIGNYSNGKPIGIWFNYYENGNIQAESVYSEELYYPTEKTYYYENGQIENTYKHYKNDYAIFDLSFNKKGDTTMCLILIDSLKLKYNFYEKYEKGNLKESGQFQMKDIIGMTQIGVWKIFNEQGVLVEEIFKHNAY